MLLHPTRTFRPTLLGRGTDILPVSSYERLAHARGAASRPRAGRPRYWLLLALLPAAAFAGFQNVTTSTGIQFAHATPGAIVSKGQGGIAIADVDADGWPDLLGSRVNDTPVLYMNQHDGTFREEAVARGLGVALDAGAFVAADFENTGRKDLFVVPERGNRFFYFANDGTGHFTQSGAPQAVGTAPHSLTIADVNNDGRLDLLTTNDTDGSVTLLTQVRPTVAPTVTFTGAPAMAA